MAFQPQQRLLAPQPACVARELATGTQNAVARHDDTHWISPHGRTHGTHGLRIVQLPCRIAIALVRATRDGQQNAPDLLLEGRAC